MVWPPDENSLWERTSAGKFNLPQCLLQASRETLPPTPTAPIRIQQALYSAGQHSLQLTHDTKRGGDL